MPKKKPHDMETICSLLHSEDGMCVAYLQLPGRKTKIYRISLEKEYENAPKNCICQPELNKSGRPEEKASYYRVTGVKENDGKLKPVYEPLEDHEQRKLHKWIHKRALLSIKDWRNTPGGFISIDKVIRYYT